MKLNVRRGDGGVEKTKANKVFIVPWVQTLILRDSDKIWHIVEYKTGMELAQAKRWEEVLALAKIRLYAVDKNETLNTIAQHAIINAEEDYYD